MPVELAARYDPQATEPRWIDEWARQKVGRADPRSAAARAGRVFTIFIPPPNVTGAAHMGHALNFTLQDVLTRLHRMRGYETLWLPGTDHAGIATQNVVEKLLAKQRKTRHDLGREAFVAEVWKWKDEYEKKILGQIRRMGASPDWDRLRFTFDDGLSAAVRHVFLRPLRARLHLPRPASRQLVPALRHGDLRRRGDARGRRRTSLLDPLSVRGRFARRADRRDHASRNDARRHRGRGEPRRRSLHGARRPRPEVAARGPRDPRRRRFVRRQVVRGPAL